jgi:hypothetical protein
MRARVAGRRRIFAARAGSGARCRSRLLCVRVAVRWQAVMNGMGMEYVLEFGQDSEELPHVWPHGRAVVADSRRACSEVAVHDVE